MPNHFLRETDRLKKKILTMGGMVEKSLKLSIQSLKTRDGKLAREVIETDKEIDQIEIDIEEECLKILALYQPVATDLRFVVAVLKINGELERIADQASNIASRAEYLSMNKEFEIPSELTGMVELSQSMLNDAIDALVTTNDQLARDVIARDDQMDDLHRKMYGLTQQRIREDIENIDCHINLLSVSRNLERVGDQVTNIAEDIIYLGTGEIARHLQS